MNPAIPLEQISVASPCHEPWDDMTGDERKRFCDRCEKHVYNFSAMTEAEIQTMLGKGDDDLCIRFYRRPDGTMLTADCPVGRQIVRRRRFFIAAAAVADYRPATVVAKKIKKNDIEMSIDLVRCPDILASVAALDDAPFTMGFAAETDNLVEYARGKLKKKKLNMIVANRVGRDCGFDRDDNAATVLWNGGEKIFPSSSKIDLARNLIELAAEHFYAVRGSETRSRLTVIANND